MIKRRTIVIGLLKHPQGRAIIRWKLRRTLGAARPGRNDGGVDMKTGKSAAAVTDRATAIVETVRPIVVKAMNDPELHDALRKAFTTGREVKDEVSGKPPSKAAQKIAKNRKLQKRVEASAQDLQKAVSNLVEPPKKKGRIKRTIGRIAIVGAVAGGVVVVLRKVRGGGGADEPY